MFRTKSEKKRVNKYINNSLISYLIYDVIFLFILIFSIMYQKRMFTFSSIFGSVFGLKNVGLYIYYGCLSIGVAFYTAMIIRTVMLSDTKKLYNILDNVEKYGDIPIFIIRCVTIILFIMIFVTTPCTVVGSSMYPTFEDGDKVMCYNLNGSYHEGDVIVFDAASYEDRLMGHENTEAGATFYIKRVVASEGDFVTYNTKSREFFVNGNKYLGVTPSQFNTIALSVGIPTDDFDFHVPKNKLIVFGDNRSFNGSSIDSRYFGAIDKGDVFGKVYLRIWPFTKFGGF